jgi:spore coat protein U-like protein
MSRAFGALLLAVSLFVAQSARAASCSLESVVPLTFGRYEPGAISGAEARGTISVLCSQLLQGETLRVVIGPGNHATGWNRHLASGPSRLAYQLYLDPNRTQIFGDGTGGSFAWTYTAGAQPATAFAIDVHGHIPAGQYVSAGSYSDSLTVTLVF